MIFEPSIYDPKNISFIAPVVKRPSRMPRNRSEMPLEGANSVGQGQDSTQAQQRVSNGPKTSENQPSKGPKLALELPSMELGGGVRTTAMRMELSPVQQEFDFSQPS